jgi:hypothetical protein
MCFVVFVNVYCLRTKVINCAGLGSFSIKQLNKTHALARHLHENGDLTMNPFKIVDNAIPDQVGYDWRVVDNSLIFNYADSGACLNKPLN